MSKEDEAERQMLARGGIIPARPKGAQLPPGTTGHSGPTPPPPLDDLLKKRQTMFGDVEPQPGSVHRVEQPSSTMAPPAYADPFDAFVEIMRILRRLPKRQQKQIIEMFADLLD